MFRRLVAIFVLRMAIRRESLHFIPSSLWLWQFHFEISPINSIAFQIRILSLAGMALNRAGSIVSLVHQVSSAQFFVTVFLLLLDLSVGPCPTRVAYKNCLA